MKTDLILKFKQNLFSKVIWSSTFNVTFSIEMDIVMIWLINYGCNHDHVTLSDESKEITERLHSYKHVFM